jgi:hypothetical protein
VDTSLHWPQVRQWRVRAASAQPAQGGGEALAEPAVEDEVGCCLAGEQQLGDDVELCELGRLDVVVVDADNGRVDDVGRLADEEDEHNDDQHQCHLPYIHELQSFRPVIA